LEASSQNKCRFGSGAWYSLAAAGAYGILLCLSLTLPRPGVLSCSVCFCWKKNDEESEEQDDEEKKEEEQDTSDEEHFEDESVVDVYSKDQDVWMVEEELTYREDPPSAQLSPPVSPTSELTTRSTLMSDDEEEDTPAKPAYTPAKPAKVGDSILRAFSRPTKSNASEQAEQQQATGIMDMWCGDPLEVATSFSQYQDGVQTNIQSLNATEKLTAAAVKNPVLSA
jgi:hypothetical protein